MATLTRITPSGPGYATAAECKAAIIAEVSKNTSDSAGWPLPVLSTWHQPGYDISQQYDYINAGYPVLPIATMDRDLTATQWTGCNWGGTTVPTDLALLVADGMPFTLINGGLEFEEPLIARSDFYSLPLTTTACSVYSQAVVNAIAVGITQIDITVSSMPFLSGSKSKVKLVNMPGDWAVLNGIEFPIASANSAHVFIAYNASGFAAYTSGGTIQGIVPSSSGATSSAISPWGASSVWYDNGADLATSAQMQYLRTNYTNPPRVIMLANAEGARLKYFSNRNEVRYRELYPDYATRQWDQIMRDTFDRLIVQTNYFLDGYSDNIDSTNWQAAAVFVEYEEFLTKRYKDCYSWFDYNPGGEGVYEGNRQNLSYAWHVWGGASPELYDADYYGNYIHNQVYSVPNQAMVYAFALPYAYAVNPDYWFELSVWDGDLWNPIGPFNTYNSTKAVTYRSLGVNYTPNYYKGWVQYGMWMTRPRCVREFRLYTIGVHDQTAPYAYLDYWDVLCEMVAAVHANPTLKSFWMDRNAVLVQNTTSFSQVYPSGVTNTHPYLARTYTSSDNSIDGSFLNATPYNYHLQTSVDVAYSVLTSCPVAADNVDNHRAAWTLAYVRGTAPTREWLIYAHSTGISGATLTNVIVTIPNYGNVTLNEVPVDGAFYHLVESESGGQLARPDADISTGDWIAVPAGSYYATLDEEFTALDDADYCYTNTPGAVMQVRLSDATDPATGYGHYLRYRVAGTTTVQLMESDTVIIATRSQVDAGLTTHVEALTPAEADAITDYDALSVRITAA